MVFNQGAPPVPSTTPSGNRNNTTRQGMSNPSAGFYVPKEYFMLAYTMFPDTPQENIQRYLPTVLQALVTYNLADPVMVLMALATIRVETGKFVPINEYQSKYNTAPNGVPYALYDFRTDIGNNAVGDGARYCGRGFIQLTGKANYGQYSKALGLGELLLQQPEQANDPTIAANLLAAFLKNKEPMIRNSLAQGDYTAARKAVNGGSHGLDQFIACMLAGAKQIGLA